MSLLVRLIRLIMKEPFYIFLSAMLGFLTIESSVGLMALSALLISDAALHFSIADLMLPIVGVRFFGISRAVFRYAERYVSHSTTFRILRQVRVWFYDRLEPLVPWKTGGLHTGDLFSRMVSDIESLKEFYLRVFNPPVVAIGVMTLTAILLASIDKMLSLGFMICFISTGFIIPILTGMIGQNPGKITLILKSKINIHLLECLSGICEISVFGIEYMYKKKLDKLSSKLLRTQRKLAMMNSFSSAVTFLASGVSLWLVLLICIPLVNAGKLRGDFLAMIAIGVMSCFEAVQAMGPYFHRLEESVSAAARLFDITDYKENVTIEKVNREMSGNLHIRTCNLHMRYSPDKALTLDDVSLTISRGKKISMVGANGSGKSSLIQVLMGVLPYEGGEVFIDDLNIKDVSREKLMDIFSVVPQNPYIFNASLLENLRLADLNASEERLWSVLSEVQLWDFVAHLPDGLHTFIGEGGFKLSGGQRQRLAIARALLRNRPILLLDEPFTGLDPKTEEILFQSLQKHWSDKSVVLITHNLSSLSSMDEIYVLDNGRVIEHGTHKALLEIKGLYWSMWQQQCHA